MTFDIILAILGFGVDATAGGVIDIWMKANAGPYYCGLSISDGTSTGVTAHFTQDPGADVAAAIQSYWAALTDESLEATTFASNNSLKVIKEKVAAARAFGTDLGDHFAAENLALGIDQDDMVDSVLTLVSPILTALQSGSLTAAISRAKAIPSGSFDAKYVTGARLLSYVNKIESYLGISLSTQWW